MHSRAELYRRRGIQAQQHAAQANQPNIKDAFEQVARDWFALAEQVEWLEGHYRALGFGEPRDRKPKSTRSGPQQATETGRHAFEPTKMPANCGLFVRERETPVRMGLHGGGCTPDRTSLIREFYRFRPSGPIFTPNRLADSVACS